LFLILVNNKKQSAEKRCLNQIGHWQCSNLEFWKKNRPITQVNPAQAAMKSIESISSPQPHPAASPRPTSGLAGFFTPTS
jgi:hypothetical protein